MPSFGPPIPKGLTFPKSNVFRDFLLAKVINAENAAHKSEKFRAMATRTRQEYLKDLAEKNVTNTPIDPSGKFPFISLASKKKEKSKPYPGAELSSMGAIVWAVRAKDYNKAMEIDCLLGVSNEFIVLIEQETKSVLFNCSCRDVIGWTSTDASLKIFYERGECVSVESFVNNDDIKEIVKRLQVSVFLPLPFPCRREPSYRTPSYFLRSSENSLHGGKEPRVYVTLASHRFFSRPSSRTSGGRHPDCASLLETHLHVTRSHCRGD